MFDNVSNTVEWTAYVYLNSTLCGSAYTYTSIVASGSQAKTIAVVSTTFYDVDKAYCRPYNMLDSCNFASGIVTTTYISSTYGIQNTVLTLPLEEYALASNLTLQGVKVVVNCQNCSISNVPTLTMSDGASLALVSANMTIESLSITLTGSPSTSIAVQSGSNLTLDGVTFNNIAVPYEGTFIYISYSHLTVLNSTFSDISLPWTPTAAPTSMPTGNC
jgi:hypothetical protein